MVLRFKEITVKLNKVFVKCHIRKMSVLPFVNRLLTAIGILANFLLSPNLGNTSLRYIVTGKNNDE